MFPIQPIYLFADSQLLFHRQDGAPFLQPIREMIDKAEPKAAYIGASNRDNPEFFSIFEAAMDTVGIDDCRMIYANYMDEDARYLKEADIILLAGGDVEVGWQALETTGMRQEIIQRYYGGALLMGVSAGAVQLGLRGWPGDNPSRQSVFETFQLIPYVIDAHDEKNEWRRLKSIVAGADRPLKGLGIPTGGGLLYHPDHTMEPIRQTLVEFSLDGEEVVQTLLLPSEKDRSRGSNKEET